MTSTTARPVPDLEPALAPVRVARSTQEATRPVCPEEVARVIATAADLVVQRRGVTVPALASLTGLDRERVETVVDELVSSGLLRATGAVPHHYAFPPGRWPCT